MKQLSRIFLAAAVMGVRASPAYASRDADQMCLGSNIRQTVKELIDTWSQGYAFAKVIIGTDARFGSVPEPVVKDEGTDYVVCHASYNLVRVERGNAYRVRLTGFDFRVTRVSEGYRVTLTDLPVTVDTDEEAAALIARFTVNDRPYAEILAKNRARLVKPGN
ncbi:hypothetical protein [Sphingomonas immobilis]|uniref:DUF4468 domain-containing protein n=1 Tax=Sphingomonas immobilis TaxID=3063997 RepID=A0ABT9A2X7_9SPHN|nr:hypothetical protein [Sphingomonas sp. CA1-15]MDO7843767.1 hypothetical protein [Sphingomonas sp. CA1-15]